MKNFFIGGGISDPESKEAQKHAEMYYEEIRHMTTDVDKIASNTGFTKAQIMLVKKIISFNDKTLKQLMTEK